jgi:hypothetical protein
MALLKNLFAKKSEYVLEIEDTKGTEAPATAPQPDPVKSEPAKVEAAKPEATAPAPAAKKAKASPKGDKKAKASSPKADKKAKAAPAAVAAPPQPVKVAPAPAKTPEPVGNFATEYLMPRTGSRRRPGANMKSFLDMASQMNRK